MIRTGKDADKEAFMRLWKRCFPLDGKRFIRFYFDKVYANDETLVYVENNQPVASLQMIPYRIKTGDTFLWGGYISGAMTHPDYRKQGYMARLLTASFETMREKGYAYTFLIPQEEYLFDYYGKFGYIKTFPEYATSYRCQTKTELSENVNIYTGFTAFDFPFLYSHYSHYLMEKTNVVLKSEQQFSNILWDFFNEKGILFANEDGLAFTHKDGKSIILTEFFSRNEETKIEFLETINSYYSVNKTIIYDDPSVQITGYKGMIKSLNESVATKTDIYMGRMLE